MAGASSRSPLRRLMDEDLAARERAIAEEVLRVRAKIE